MDAIGLRWLTQSWLLNTESATAPVCRRRLFPRARPGLQHGGWGERVEEELILNLRGTAAEIQTGLGTLQRLLNEAGNPPGSPPPGALLLFVQRAGETAPWESRVYGGRLELLGDIQRERQRHSQGVRLTLQREHAWEYADPYPVPLSNGNGSRVTAGLLVHNHLDATRRARQLRRGGRGGCTRRPACPPVDPNEAYPQERGQPGQRVDPPTGGKPGRQPAQRVGR